MIHIGHYQIPNKLALAPMAGVTDRVFRDICRDNGAGYLIGEMLSAHMSLEKNNKKSKTVLRVAQHDEPEPRAIQLLGNDPLVMAEAAKHNVAKGAQIIDINMGCPAKKVCSKAAGSALMRDEKLVAEIITAVVSAVDVPVTLKTRTGWSDEIKNGLAIAQTAQDSGVQSIAIHGRTRSQKFNGQAEYDTIAEIKSALSIPVWANGDIDSPEKAAEILDYTQADGLMIGRSAQGNPWLFNQINYFLETGQKLSTPSLESRRKVMVQHLQGLHKIYGDFMGVRIARKHIGWYLKEIDLKKSFLREFNKLESTQTQFEAIHTFFDLVTQKENEQEQTIFAN